MMLKIFFLIFLAFPVLGMEITKITLPDTEIVLRTEIAKTDAERAKGLSHRKNLPENAAMLFVHTQPQIVIMWMKDCAISLDMVFMDKDGKIIFLQENTVPFSLTHIVSPPHTKYVLEVNAGMIKKHNIRLGKTIKIK